ncbi:MAG: hypothetical protein RMN24_11080, partial [Anaerolineae bacterium]|nr:hypothetical protein [Anaerolineae bacterium]
MAKPYNGVNVTAARKPPRKPKKKAAIKIGDNVWKKKGLVIPPVRAKAKAASRRSSPNNGGN